MIKYQILRTNILRIVQQVVRRIAIRILGVNLTSSQMNIVPLKIYCHKFCYVFCVFMSDFHKSPCAFGKNMLPLISRSDSLMGSTNNASHMR